eukprot:6180665-Pleurochrysis_carterae.AAC.5
MLPMCRSAWKSPPSTMESAATPALRKHLHTRACRRGRREGTRAGAPTSQEDRGAHERLRTYPPLTGRGILRQEGEGEQEQKRRRSRLWTSLVLAVTRQQVKSPQEASANGQGVSYSSTPWHALDPSDRTANPARKRAQPKTSGRRVSRGEGCNRSPEAPTHVWRRRASLTQGLGERSLPAHVVVVA